MSFKPSFPIIGVLGLIFITLRLCDVIAWSWWWVLAPFWIPFALMLVVLLVCAAVYAIASIGGR